MTVMQAVLILALYTFVPALELRFSIPYGLVNYSSLMGASSVVAVCIVANILLAPAVWLFIDRGMNVFLRVGWIERLYSRIVTRTRERLHPYVERWGTLGLAVFIGVPLPGSGVYSGALGAYLLGFGLRQYLLASVLGVLIAAAAVTAVAVTGVAALDFVLKH